MCITAQFPTISQVYITIEEALSELTEYYLFNSLCANPDKTQVIAFHLWNREAKRSLKVSSYGVDLENTTQPKYSRQDVDLQTPHTEHQDEGSYPQQPFLPLALNANLMYILFRCQINCVLCTKVFLCK